MLSGPTSAEGLKHTYANLVTTHVLGVDGQLDEGDGLEEQLRSLWDLESLGIVGAEKTLYDEFLNKLLFGMVDMRHPALEKKKKSLPTTIR